MMLTERSVRMPGLLPMSIALYCLSVWAIKTSKRSETVAHLSREGSYGTLKRPEPFTAQ